MLKDNINTLQNFIRMVQEERNHIQLKGTLQAKMDYMQYVIRSEFDKNSKEVYKFKKRKAELDEQFIHCIESMSREQKIKYYQQFLTIIKCLDKGIDEPRPIRSQILTCQAYTRSYNLKIWKKKKIRLDCSKSMLYIQKSEKIKHFNLGDYLIRQSKNKDYHTCVLEATNNYPHQRSRTVHIGFSDAKLYQTWYKAIQYSIQQKNWENIAKMFGKENMAFSAIKFNNSNVNFAQNEGQKVRNSDITHNRNKNEEKRQIEEVDSSDEESPQKSKKIKEEVIKAEEAINNTIIDSLMESDNDEEIEKIVQSQKQINKSKKHLDLFHKILPDYELQDLQTNHQYQYIVNDVNFKILQHKNTRTKLKAQIIFDQKIPKQAIFNSIVNTNLFTQINDSIQEICIKTMIASENSAIIYQKNKAYNKLYRCRDFVYIRHAFSNAGDIYLIDKSLENSNYPPFMTIVRGKLCIFWGILNRKNRKMLIIDIQQQNSGYLNEQQQINLNIQYINSLKNMQKTISKQMDNLVKLKIFDLGWDITKNEKNKISNQIRKRKKSQRLFLKKSEEKEINNSPVQNYKVGSRPSNNQEQKQEFNQISFQKKQKKNQSIQKGKMPIVGEIDLAELNLLQKQKTVVSIERQLDKQGYIVISNKYQKTKFSMRPTPPKEFVYQPIIVDHPIWKGQWLHDDNEGAMIFINERKIEDQKGVLKFIISKVAKNILSGKGIMNISLPVDIFGPESNLQRLLYSMTYAPIYLQKVVKKPPLERLKAAIAFGLSNSLLYLSMEKPFNPILGETFQCWINGCPGYAEQISHHPPIGAILFIGRGYRISAQLESKVDLSLNTGCGTNEGIYRLVFEDGIQICFITPGGQLSGLTYGDRKFNIIGKSYYWIQKENIMLEIVFNPAKKGFFSVGKQAMPLDYFEGQIYQVKPEFMKSFVTKRKTPSEKEIITNLGKISGIWNKYLNFQNTTLMDVTKDYPLILEYQPNSLPSDANWREDIHYRRIMEVTRAQTEKQRLQVLQRTDRKLRQAKGGKH